ncbi:MAG: hypothetical protein D6705_14910 [Deltaproteobacteria bacterium]|nr:MAG: hypothetical protein D6705_14910 [Deltaproteobacteria bacterium]
MDDGWLCAPSTESDGELASFPVGHFVRVLFVVDPSPGMATVQQKMARAGAALLTALGERGLAFAATVLSADAGSVGDACPAPNDPGRPAFTSCRARLDAFAPGPDTGVDPAAACTDVCSLDVLPEAVDPLDGSPLPGVVAYADPQQVQDAADRLACALPLGNTGCPLAQPVAALDAFAKDPPTLWTAGMATDLVVFVGDGPDCSAQDPSIFDVAGSKVFFEDPNATEATDAVCWNAGVACEGDPTGYDDCLPQDYDATGAPTDDRDAAVLTSLASPASLILDWKAIATDVGYVFTAVVGGFDPSDPDADPAFAKGADPGFVAEHGIDPGCTADQVAATPPVRIRAFADAVSLEANPGVEGPLQVSACGDDAETRLALLAERADEARTRCGIQPCVFDADPDAPGVQPICHVELLSGTDRMALPPCDDDGGVPAGQVACVRYLPAEACGAGFPFAYRVEVAPDALETLHPGAVVIVPRCVWGTIDPATNACDPRTPADGPP